MVDINKVELLEGDYILIAFNSCGQQHLEYATITKIDGTDLKIKFESNKYFWGKTRTLHIYNSKCLKVERC